MPAPAAAAVVNASPKLEPAAAAPKAKIDTTAREASKGDRAGDTPRFDDALKRARTKPEPADARQDAKVAPTQTKKPTKSQKTSKVKSSKPNEKPNEKPAEPAEAVTDGESPVELPASDATQVPPVGMDATTEQDVPPVESTSNLDVLPVAALAVPPVQPMSPVQTIVDEAPDAAKRVAVESDVDIAPLVRPVAPGASTGAFAQPPDAATDSAEAAGDGAQVAAAASEPVDDHEPAPIALKRGRPTDPVVRADEAAPAEKPTSPVAARAPARHAEQPAAPPVESRADHRTPPDDAPQQGVEPDDAVSSVEASEPTRKPLAAPASPSVTPTDVTASSVAALKPEPRASAESAPMPAPAPAPPTPREVEFAQANHDRIVTDIRAQLLPRGGTMQIRLDPPQLGALQVAVHMLDGVMSVSFQTSSEDATQLLSHSLTQLKQVLESQGVAVDKLHVQQAPRNEQSSGNSNDADQQSHRHGPQDENLARQEQQRKEMLRRMWRRLALGNDPLDLVA